MENFLQNKYHVGIVGAGPIGVQLAFLLSNAGISYVIFDKGQIGNTIAQWPDHTRFHSSPDTIILGDVKLSTSWQEHMTKEEYLNYMRGFALLKSIKINSFEEVVDIKNKSEYFNIITKSHKSFTNNYNVKYLIFAIGSSHKSNVPDINGLNEISYYDIRFPIHNTYQKEIAIIGGRHSAIEYSIRAARAGASKVNLISRSDIYTADRLKKNQIDDLVKLVKLQRINLFCSQEITSIDKQFLNIKHLHSYDIKNIGYDFIIVACGYRFETRLFDLVGVCYNENSKPSIDLVTMETNVNNCFVIGTATAGQQISTHSLFIENCIIHADSVFQAIKEREIKN